MASLEHVLHLFDSKWFHNQIFQENCDQIWRYKNEEPEEELEKSPRGGRSTQSLKVRSHSDNFLISSGTSFLSDSQSPTSVLPTPRLQTIFSGKEMAGFGKPKGPNETIITQVAPKKLCVNKNVNRQRKRQGRGRAGKWSSKSLTDLEFEELKGFKDLGFVFSEEDNEDADLLSIVPGLQRLRRRSDSVESVTNVERPYLSEAWSVMEKKEALMKPAALIINHRIRQGGMDNEMLMKEQIKRWAHSVATAIK